MNEGAWINSITGQFFWIDEHARWLHRRDRAEAIGLPAQVIEEIQRIPLDFNGEYRRATLFLAMRNGLIRFRGHDHQVTFESVLPKEEVIRCTADFMAANFGPLTWVRINNLETGEEWGANWADMQP